MSDFVHLHVHTEYSMLDGLSRIPELITETKSHSQTALALTDHGGMYGAINFYNSCNKAGIKPIIGVEAYMAKKSRFDKQTKMGSDQFHLTLLAQNFTGYQNLMRLTSQANLEGFSYKPRIDKEILEKYSSGVIVTSGCMSSIFNKLLVDGKDKEALEWFQDFRELFPERFYIEIQRHQIKELDSLNKKLISISRKLDLPLVATNDVHYTKANQAEAQDALLCVQTRKLISDKKRMSMLSTPDLYLKSSKEMVDAFYDLPEAIKNTMVIAEQCNLEIPTGKLIFPNFPLPKGKTDAKYLEELTAKGLKKRFPKITAEHKKRVSYELNIINTKGYATYFLITQDFVLWAKNQGIGVGPGRGSVAGSLVSYALEITDINPLDHSLPFERFLNPDRPTPPDIDIDFADDRRDEVIEYAADKYGKDRVAQVITFGRMEARVSIRDIGRVLGMPYEEPDRIAKLIPNHPGRKVSLEKAVATVPDLTEYYKQPKYKKLIDLAKQVEGVIRHSSVHAAAVVISDEPLTNYTPIQRESKSGKTVTQYDMYVMDLNISDDAIGLLKFDFLGLRNLSTIQRALQLIKENKKIDLDLTSLKLDDSKTYALLSRGETMGVFQLESAGMRRVAVNLKPNQFSDITAMLALYRPGPMSLIPQFIESKHNPKKIVYPHKSLIPILEETYGVMVYQEQILQIANVMAGYSLGEADILRRAIGKKKKKLLDENKIRFIEQSIAKKYSKQVAEKVWSFIEAFADYGFNKAHAASYAMISYQTAYLKANYPVEYMAALMSVESDSHSASRDEKVALAIEACKSMGITILPPDINSSDQDFTIEPYTKSLEKLAIRFGLSAIKHVGTAAIEDIIATRNKLKSFSSVTQFIQETDSRKVNKKVLECLIKVGAMDRFGTRSSMLENLEDMRHRASQFQSDIDGQDNLFAKVKTSSTAIKDSLPSLREYPKQELLTFEKELLGLYLTDHPLSKVLASVSSQASKTITELDPSIHSGRTFVFGGVITKLREVRTKKTGALMAFGSLDDKTGVLEFVVFPKTYSSYADLLKIDGIVLIRAKVEERDSELKMIVERVSSPDQNSADQTDDPNIKEVFIPRKTNKKTLEKLGKLLKSKKGDDKVAIMIPNGAQPKRMTLPYTVEWSKKLESEVKELLKK